MLSNINYPDSDNFNSWDNHRMNKRMHLRTSRLQALSFNEACSLISSNVTSPQSGYTPFKTGSYLTSKRSNCSNDDDFHSLLDSLNTMVVPISPAYSSRNRSASLYNAKTTKSTSTNASPSNSQSIVAEPKGLKFSPRPPLA